jgi:hypothetical protein
MRRFVCLVALCCLAVPATHVPAAAPEVVFATLLGGSDFDDCHDIAVDASGAIYVVGTTTSTDFPTVNALQPALASQATSDAFVVKIAPDGQTVIFATYLGGTDADNGTAIAVDASGAVYVAGSTRSTNFPVLGGFQPQSAGGTDAFVAKLSADGRSLVYSTYYGGTGDDFVADLRVRADGSVAFGGRTTSKLLPLVAPLQDANAGGAADGFVAVLGAAGSSLVSATFAGGNGDDQIDALVIGLTNGVYASGVSTSTNFATCPIGDESQPRSFILVAAGAPPRTPYAFPCSPNSSIAACPMAGGPTPAGFQLRALTGGGSGSLDVRAVTTDAELDFVRERLFGGMGQDYPDAIAVGIDGGTIVAGDTDSEDFPTVEPTQPANGGFVDAFVTVLAPGTDEPTFSTYLGGSDVEFPAAVATDAEGNIYVAGVTFSTDFPTSPDALQGELSGPTDGFVVKFAAPEPAGPDFAISASPSTVTLPRKGKMQVSIDVVRTGGFTGSVTVRPPDTRAIKVKITPPSVPTAGDAALFSIKVKKKAVPGT